MAEMTSEMYGAQGRVGNKTYYRANGKTVAREIVPVKNPKTDLQTLQRVIAKQVGMDYKKFREICDHSFEGITTGANSAAKFRSLNMKAKRSRAAEINQAGQSLSAYYNFQPVGSEKWVPGAVILSQGQLPKVVATVSQDELGLYLGHVAVAENTYAGVCAALGLKRGDQLTFVTVEKKNDEYQVFLSRIILDPRNQDGSGAAMTTAFITDGAIVSPNWRNKFNFTYLTFTTGSVNFAQGGNGATLVGAAIIVSRKDSDSWLRSNAELTVSEAACGSDKSSLYDAIAGSYSNDTIDMESEFYLNNAGEGGTQSGSSSSAANDTTPSYSNNVAINGIQANVSGGSVNVTAPLNTIVISGTNLSEAPVTARQAGESQDTQPTKTATTISFSFNALPAGASVTVKKDGTTWFTVTAVAAGGDDDGGGDAD